MKRPTPPGKLAFLCPAHFCCAYVHQYLRKLPVYESNFFPGVPASISSIFLLCTTFLFFFLLGWQTRKGRKRLASQMCWKVRWGLGSWWESGLARFQDVAWLCTAGKEAGDHGRVRGILASSGTDAGALGGQVRQQLNLPECPCSTGRAAHSPHGPLLRRRGGLKAVVSPPRGGT